MSATPDHPPASAAGEDLQPVLDWHTAVNEQDLDLARATADGSIAVGGPQGTAVGVEVFLDWIRRVGIRLEPTSWHPVDAGTVVVGQDATWETGEPQQVATLFRVAGGRVTAALRFPTVQAALDAVVTTS